MPRNNPVLGGREHESSQRNLTPTSDSDVPAYPASDRPAPAPPNNASTPRSLASRELSDDCPTAASQNGGHPHSRRPDTTSTTTSFASASADTSAHASSASGPGSRHTSPRKQAAPSRIGRDFEALLASDETYVLRESATTALDTEAKQEATSQSLWTSPSSSARRVIVERRRQRSTSSSSSAKFDEMDEDEQLLGTTPRPSRLDAFQSPQRKTQSSRAPATPAQSVSANSRGNGAHVPTSPDRTTSLQRHTTGSSAGPSPSSNRQAAPISAMPGFSLSPEAGSANGTSRSRPRLNSSVGLEQEIQPISSSQNSSDTAASSVSFRQRMKKTSGFLRRLRKDATPVRRKKDAVRPGQPGSAGHAYSTGSNPSTTSIGRRSGNSELSVGAASLGRRESKASVASLGASSATGSTHQGTLFASADGGAVPSIPERFMQSSTSSNSHNATGPTAIETSRPERGVAISPETQKLAPLSKAALRVPSAPASVTEWGTADKFALPQRSSSQGHEHQRNKSLASSDSTGAIRLAVAQLSSHMDDAWKEEPAQRIQIAEQPAASALKQAWGPSPQLPELGIDHYKERSGSFLEEPELVSTDVFGGVDAVAPKNSRSFSASSYPNTPTSRVPSRGSVSREAAGLGIAPVEESEPGPQMQQVSSGASRDFKSSRAKYDDSTIDGARLLSRKLVPTQPTTSPRRPVQPGTPPATDLPRDVDSVRNSPRDSIDRVADNRRRRTIDSGASLVSVRSFETAAESAGIGSADPKVASFNSPLNEQQKFADAARTGSPSAEPLADSPLTAHSMPRTQSPTAKEGGRLEQYYSSDSTEDQEQSIRLVTKRSKTEDINLSSEPNAGSTTTTIITAPASSDMVSSVLPRMVELSEQSLLRPGHNGSLDRGASVSSASGRSGVTGLLTTSSALRSPSPVSSPVSARTSFDVSVTRPVNEGAVASPALAASAQELATKCWEEDPEFLKREKIAEWLGGLGLVNRAARSHYFANFDFSGLRLDVAFRRLCDKLFLRAETQQIDRVLAAFSQRYYDCNPDSIFGSADVIHSVVFSILLLNTDLHIAELQERMTLKQFVRNTLGAIAESSADEQSLPARDDSRSSFSVAPSDLTRSVDAVPQKVDPAQRRNSISSYLGSRSKQMSSTTNLEASADAPHQVGSRPGTATSGAKGKEAEIETLLRDIYAAVKAERILLPHPESGSGNVAAGRPSGTFTPIGGGRRKMGMGSDRMTALKRGSIRGIQGLLGGIGPNASLLDPGLSPNPSRSSVDSWGRPSQSLASSGDRDRMLSPLPTITPGFASTLSQTIIKESMEEDAASGLAKSSSAKESALDEEDDDDQLALAGPPWAKEGSLTRKHLWESAGKRAKDKSWTEVFVVVSKGTLSMFRFDLGGSSSTSAGASSKAKSRPSMAAQSSGGAVGGGSGAALGGGNWLSNATCLGEISLAHSLANALPPPGYNKTRPHVFALTLPGGRVYLFQTGHEELINEWVSTCNYWAARQSKEPLPGGVSNMEYGWNKVLPQPDMDDAYEELDSFSSNAHAQMSRASSLQPQQTSSADSRSVRSGKSSNNASRAFFGSPATSAAASISTSSNVGYLTNERTFINEWRTPQLPTLPSTLSEERQLTRLEKQVRTIESELTQHNELRQPMLQLYSPKGGNYAKALGNWERKSNWLLQELVKYQSYVESLRKSSDVKAERRAKREVEEMVREGDEMLARLEV